MKIISLIFFVFIAQIYFTMSQTQMTELNDSLSGRMHIKQITQSKNAIWAISDSYLFKSFDKGDNWIKVRREDKINFISANNTSLIMSCDKGFIYISLDEGQTWDKKKICDSIISCLYASQKTWIAGTTGQGVFCSSDNGKTWSNQNQGLKNLEISRVASCKDNFILTASDGFYYSSDEGKSWNFTLKCGGYNKNIAIYDSLAFICKWYSSTIYKSTDKGVNWQQLENTIDTAVHSGIYFSKNKLIATGEWGKNYISEDFGLTWSILNSDIKSCILDVFSVDDRTFFHYDGCYNKYILMDYSDDFGKTLKPLKKGLNPGVDCIYAYNDTLLISTDYGSTDFGRFYQYHEPSKMFKKIDIYYKVRSIDKNGSVIAVGTNKGLYYSIDYGSNWLKTSPVNYRETINCVDISEDKNEIIAGFDSLGLWYFGKYENEWGRLLSSKFDNQSVKSFIFHNNDMYVSFYNYGLLRNQNDLFTFDSLKKILCMGVYRNIFIGTSGYGLFRLDNKLYKILISKTGFDTVNHISVKGNNILISSPSAGLLLSRDNGTSWEEYNGDLIFSKAKSESEEIAYKPAVNNFFIDNKTVYIATSDGVYQRNDEYLSIEQEKKNELVIPNIIFSPNPATDYIEISLGAQGAVPDGVSIFNILGIEQFALTPTLSLKGERVRIDISSLPPGVYFVRVGDMVRKFVKL